MIDRARKEKPDDLQVVNVHPERLFFPVLCDGPVEEVGDQRDQVDEEGCLDVIERDPAVAEDVAVLPVIAASSHRLVLFGICERDTREKFEDHVKKE